MREDTPDRLVITQKPNLPIIVAITATLASFSGLINYYAGEFFELIAFGAWFTWAWLEIFQGVNVFRRALGGVTMVVVFIVAFVVIGYLFRR